MQASQNESFKHNFATHLKYIDSKIQFILKQTSFNLAPTPFKKAILYSLIAPGKKLRSIMLLEMASQLGYSKLNALKMAIAIECLHTYSLVHDDLPAMDNDDIRRGKASSHKKWGEDVAILVGDALHTLSFEILASILPIQSSTIKYFASSVGSAGLIAGQYLDLQKKKLTKKKIYNIFHLKTAKLFELSLCLPYLEVSQKSHSKIAQWGLNFGLLFQLLDDLNDYNDSIHDKNELNICTLYSQKTIEKEIQNKVALLNKNAVKIFKEPYFFLGCINKCI